MNEVYKTMDFNGNIGSESESSINRIKWKTVEVVIPDKFAIRWENLSIVIYLTF